MGSSVEDHDGIDGYTNHTILPEAGEVAGGHVRPPPPASSQIIYEINARFMRNVATRYPLDSDRLRRMSIVEEGGRKEHPYGAPGHHRSSSVNGVAALHTRLLKDKVLRDFAEYWPAKFNNKTNGITPRRWLLKANPPLARLITESIGDGWITDLAN